MYVSANSIFLQTTVDKDIHKRNATNSFAEKKFENRECFSLPGNFGLSGFTYQKQNRISNKKQFLQIEINCALPCKKSGLKLPV